MSELFLTILVPVLNRPKNVDRFVNSFLQNTPLNKARILFITGQDCHEEIQAIRSCQGPIDFQIVPPDILSWAKRINWGFNYLNSINSECSWALCGADDIVFHPNWLEIAEKASENFCGIIGTNDLGHPACISGSHTTHPIVSREYVSKHGTIDELNKFCHEGYHHNYVDVEFVSTAKKRNMWKHESSCIIEHLHPSWNKASWDDVYQKGKDNWENDKQLWVKRSQLFRL